jgi:hypothetical protein
LPEFTYFELDKEVDKYKITIFDKWNKRNYTS